MPQSLSRIIVHVIFSTKHRTPWLKDKEIRRELYRYVATILNTLESPAITINGTEDHVHILCSLSRNHALKKIIGDVKADSSKWMKTKARGLEHFYWQAGYGAFSVSESKLDDVKAYIVNQEEHHRQRSFRDEFRQICERHRVEIDEKYVWG